MMKKIILFSFIFCLCSIPAFSADFFIAQSAVGDASGSSCANAHAISGLTWGSGNNVAAGDTLHLCGTITTAITVGTSGTAGNIITIKFG